VNHSTPIAIIFLNLGYNRSLGGIGIWDKPFETYAYGLHSPFIPSQIILSKKERILNQDRRQAYNQLIKDQ
jgi:hypothetical protein